MMRKLVAALGLSVIAGMAVAETEMDELLKPCVSCHGMDGVGTAAKTPHLNWQLPAYLADTMRALQSGARPTAVPKHIPKSMTQEQLVAIGEFYGANRTPRILSSFDAAKAAKGLSVYQGRCADCHLDNGRSTDDKGAGTPILAGQPVEYIFAQEQLYMSGKRRFARLADKAHEGMTPEDLEAVAHYFGSLDPQQPVPEDKKKRKRRS